MHEATQADFDRWRAAVQLRDRCVKAAIDLLRNAGLCLSQQCARGSYDAMVGMIRLDERERAADRVRALAEVWESVSLEQVAQAILCADRDGGADRG